MRYKLTLAYDGTDFRGFAEQPDQRTIGGSVREVLEKVLHTPIQYSVAGRTDAGVHAWGQVMSFDAPSDSEPATIQRALNGHLAPEIVAREISVVDDGFDARFSAVSRTYRYSVTNESVPDPRRARYSWWVKDDLDVDVLNAAALHLVGEHDFASFCRRGPEGTTTIRRVINAEWRRGEELQFEITANAFCWQMVRSITGTLVDVGLGKFRPNAIPQMLDARSREKAGQIAPPHGLMLWGVDYL